MSIEWRGGGTGVTVIDFRYTKAMWLNYLVFKRVVFLSIRHAAALEPAVKDLCHSAQHSLALGAQMAAHDNAKEHDKQIGSQLRT